MADIMYLIYGESFRLINEEINKIIKNEKNIITYDLNVSTLEDVINEANYVSLFLEKKILIVKNALFFTAEKKDSQDTDLLIKYMENKNPNTTIIFTTYEKVDARKKVYKEFQKTNKVICVNNININDLYTKVRDIFFKNKYKVSNEVLTYLVNSCNSNYDLIYNECQKIFLYYQNPTNINLEDVFLITSKTTIDNNFKFVDLVINKDLKNIDKVLEDLYSLKVDPINLLVLLTREYRLMLSTIILRQNSYKDGEISKILSLQDWQLKKIVKNSTNYREEDLKTYLKELANIDYEIKSGKKDRFMELKKFLLMI